VTGSPVTNAAGVLTLAVKVIAVPDCADEEDAERVVVL
jgi:hypothetical protein